jgi:putative transposase
VNLTTDTSNRHIVYSSQYHVDWCPKYRRHVRVGAVAKRLARLLTTRCTELKVDILALEIRPNHVPLLCDVDPPFGVHRLKGQTSHTPGLEFPR